MPCVLYPPCSCSSSSPAYSPSLSPALIAWSNDDDDDIAVPDGSDEADALGPRLLRLVVVVIVTGCRMDEPVMDGETVEAVDMGWPRWRRCPPAAAMAAPERAVRAGD